MRTWHQASHHHTSGLTPSHIRPNTRPDIRLGQVYCVRLTPSHTRSHTLHIRPRQDCCMNDILGRVRRCLPVPCGCCTSILRFESSVAKKAHLPHAAPAVGVAPQAAGPARVRLVAGSHTCSHAARAGETQTARLRCVKRRAGPLSAA